MLLALPFLLVELVDEAEGLDALALFIFLALVVDVHVVHTHLDLLISQDVLAVLIFHLPLGATSRFITLIVFPRVIFPIIRFGMLFAALGFEHARSDIGEHFFVHLGKSLLNTFEEMAWSAFIKVPID